jgi:hypothetical protein
MEFDRYLNSYYYNKNMKKAIITRIKYEMKRYTNNTL